MFYPSLEDHFLRGFQKILSLCLVSVLKRFIIKSRLWLRGYAILIEGNLGIKPGEQLGGQVIINFWEAWLTLYTRLNIPIRIQACFR